MSMTHVSAASKAASLATSKMPPPVPPNTAIAGPAVGGGGGDGGPYSGLSALILAATSQLGHLIDNDTASASEGSHLTPALDSEGDTMRMDSPPPLSSHHMPPNFEGRAAQIVVPPHHRSRSQTGTITARHLAFPEQLMGLLMDTENNQDVVTFLPDGKYFAIRRKVFAEKYLYNVFHLTTYDEFLELMRGWGFVRVNTNHAAEEEEEESKARPTSPTLSASNPPSNDAAPSVPVGTSTAVQASSRATIQVFKHPQHQYFKKGHPVDMEKIRFLLGKGHSSKRQQNHDMAAAVASQLMKATASPEMTAAVPTSGGMQLATSVSDDSTASNLDGPMSNSKRRLSPSHLNRDSEDALQKQRMIMDQLHHPPVSSWTEESGYADGRSIPMLALDQQPVQSARMARRRSSLELRSVASEITTSQLKLQSNEQGEDADEDGPITEGAKAVNTVTPSSRQPIYGDASMSAGMQYSILRKSERRFSSSSLIDGAVEAATHTIVTDAIESLLFDESHTRETYQKHEKELSVSSLPGVVPISKQLFSGRPRTGSASSDIARDATTNDDDMGIVSSEKNMEATPAVPSAGNSNSNSIPGMPPSLSAACLVNSPARSDSASRSTVSGSVQPLVTKEQQEALGRLASAMCTGLSPARQLQQK